MPRKEKTSRYRSEAGYMCIDIRLRNANQLFDGRDPAPFRERDLDPEAVDYIRSAAEEIPHAKLLKIVLFLGDPIAAPLTTAIVESAIRIQFDHERDLIVRRLRQERQFGQVALAVGLTALVAMLSLAELTQKLPQGFARDILREGLVITGWVAMWKPIEILLYDWWPLRRARLHIDRIVAAPIDVRQASAESKTTLMVPT